MLTDLQCAVDDIRLCKIQERIAFESLRIYGNSTYLGYDWRMFKQVLFNLREEYETQEIDMVVRRALGVHQPTKRR